MDTCTLPLKASTPLFLPGACQKEHGLWSQLNHGRDSWTVPFLAACLGDTNWTSLELSFLVHQAKTSVKSQTLQQLLPFPSGPHP